MRQRISIRGCVRPSVGPSVRPPVRRSVRRSGMASLRRELGASYAVYTALLTDKRENDKQTSTFSAYLIMKSKMFKKETL